MEKNVYTVRSEDGWGYRKEGTDRISKKLDTQKEAINYSREQARKNNKQARLISLACLLFFYVLPINGLFL